MRKGSATAKEVVNIQPVLDGAADAAWMAAQAAATAVTAAELAGRQWGAIVGYDVTVRPHYDKYAHFPCIDVSFLY